MAMHWLSVLCLLSQHQSGTALADLPEFPEEYSAVIEISMPYIGLKLPMRVVTSKGTQKIENYNGLETEVSSSKGTYKFTFNNSRRVCMFKASTSGPKMGLEVDEWKPQLFFPNLSEYKLEGDALVGGIMCQKYTLHVAHGTTGLMSDDFSFYWDPVLSMPVRWHQHARALPYDSHTDEYIFDYLNLQPGTPTEHDLELPDKDNLCQHPVSANIASRATGLLAAFRHDTILEKNVRFVASLNEKHAGMTSFKGNHFSGMTWSEIKQYRGGKLKGSSHGRRTAEHQKYISLHAVSGRALPESADWRTTPGVVGPVKDQAMCGSCWTYGALGPVESIHAIQTGHLTTLPEQFMLDCTWTNHSGSSGGNFGCDGGDSDIGLLEIVRKFGGIIPSATAYGSYLAVNGYCKDTRLMEVGAKVSGWRDIPKGSIYAFVDALFHVGPISVGIMVPDEMLYYESGVLDVPTCACDEAQIDHAVFVVGYGVDASGKHFYTVRNSWSTYWGNQGYINVAQGRNDCCITAQAGYPVVEAVARGVVVV